jgi:site-specific recombinase XerD
MCPLTANFLSAMAARHPRSFAPDDRTGDLAEEFLDAQLSPRTRAGYTTDLAHFFEWMHERGINPLDAERPHLDRYRNHMTELVDGRPRLANATVARRLAAVRSFYTYLVDRRVLAGSPAVGVKSPAVSRDPQGKALTVDQIKALLHTAREHSPDAEAIVALLGLNGLRVSEVCGAQVEDLRRESGGGRSLRVRGKGGKEVWVALNKTTERAVMRAVGGRSSGPLVRRPADRRRTPGSVAPLRPYNRQAVWQLLRELGRDADLLGDRKALDRLHPHLMRHGFIQALLDAGVGLAQTQDAARHADPGTTRRYDRMRNAYREHPTHLLDIDDEVDA